MRCHSLRCCNLLAERPLLLRVRRKQGWMRRQPRRMEQHQVLHQVLLAGFVPHSLLLHWAMLVDHLRGEEPMLHRRPVHVPLWHRPRWMLRQRHLLAHAAHVRQLLRRQVMRSQVPPVHSHPMQVKRLLCPVSVRLHRWPPEERLQQLVHVLPGPVPVLLVLRFGGMPNPSPKRQRQRPGGPPSLMIDEFCIFRRYTIRKTCQNGLNHK